MTLAAAVQTGNRRVGLLMDGLPEAVATTDVSYVITGWNLAAERLFGSPRSSMIGASIFDVVADGPGPDSDHDLRAVLGRGEVWTTRAVAKDVHGAPLELRLSVAPIGPCGASEGYVMVALDVTAEVRAQRAAHLAESRFSEFMAAAPAIVFIKDHAGRYVFSNGYIGTGGGHLDKAGWEGHTDQELWPAGVAMSIRENDMEALAAAVPLESTQIVPMVDGPHTLLIHKFRLRGPADVPLLGGIGVDITDRVRAQAAVHRGREREKHVERLASERATVAQALVHLRTGDSLATIAASIVQLVASLPGFDSASLLLFDPASQVTSIHGSHPVTGFQLGPMTRAEVASLHRQAAAGPWVHVPGTSTNDPVDALLRGTTPGAVGCAPLLSGAAVLGVILAVSDDRPEMMWERLPAVIEFAGLAGGLLGPSVLEHKRVAAAEARIRSVIRLRGFDIVFQPIVELARGVTVGVEALTRFPGVLDPGAMLAEATLVGLGERLELITLAAALRLARALPVGLWLDVEISPGLVSSGTALAALLRDQDRSIVCQITEQAGIEDYPGFLAALRRLDGVRLAVADAGAGPASFRHILELHPEFVKLDRSLVGGIDHDSARQALVAGMQYFAQLSGCRLIAAGIETPGELATITALGVPFGQGDLLGPPAPSLVESDG